MSADWYTLLSLGMRYWFTILAALIVYRAWRATIRDNRRARALRAWAPDTGAVGEIVLLSGGGSLRKGQRIPVPKEGLLGSSRRADVRIRHPEIRRYHAHLEQREDGLLVEPVGGAEVFLNGQTAEKLLLRSGDSFSIGGLKLMLVLYDAGAQPTDPLGEDDLFSPVGVAAAKPKPGGKGGKSGPGKKRQEGVRTRKTAAAKGRKQPSADTLFMPFEDTPISETQRQNTKRTKRGR